jgi:DNA repair protein RadC
MYTIPQKRCKLVSDGAKVRSPINAIQCSADAITFFRAYFERESLPHERFLCALVNGRNEIMALVRVSEGGLHGCAVLPADVLRPAVVAGASAIVVSHNHPSGNPEPSADDLQMTVVLKQASKALGISLLDHVIVAAGGQATSLADLGLL